MLSNTIIHLETQLFLDDYLGDRSHPFKITADFSKIECQPLKHAIVTNMTITQNHAKSVVD